MAAGIAALVAAYVFSQFYRAFLAVLSPVLAAELGTRPETLASASGWWFLSFALMQLPVGAALDRIGPRRTAGLLFAVAALGAGLFAAARSPFGINLAMVLIGAGCAPILMAAYLIFARSLPAAAFGTLAGLTIGIGSLGNIGAALPLSAAVEAFGWRATVAGLAGVTGAISVLILFLVRDPPRLATAGSGSVLDVLRLPGLWPVLVMMAACYGPAAGLRGLWAGPWLTATEGAEAGRIGQVTLVMGLAMVAGNLLYGPLDRWTGTRKWVVFTGNALVLAAFLLLWADPSRAGGRAVALVALVGLAGAAFPMVMAHGRAFLPAHLIGRGVSLINLFGIGAAGLMQMATGRIYAAAGGKAAGVEAFGAVFLFYAAVVAAGLAVYLLARDRTD